MESLIALVTAFPRALDLIAGFIGAILHIAHHQERSLSKADPVASKRSKAIDQLLREDFKAIKQRYTVLPLGAFSMEEIIQQLMDGSEVGLAKDDLTQHRHDVHQFVITCTRKLLDLISGDTIPLSSDAKRSYNYLCNLVADPGAIMTEEIGQAIDAIWRDSLINKGLNPSIDFELTRSAR